MKKIKPFFFSTQKPFLLLHSRLLLRGVAFLLIPSLAPTLGPSLASPRSNAALRTIMPRAKYHQSKIGTSCLKRQTPLFLSLCIVAPSAATSGTVTSTPYCHQTCYGH
ncbi:hypothetical protein VIGAN_07063600 [Vigna angularis var. angularis]|uniref:Uncharacterized protein n=1 Tax=Vigna angularis var. angularis TaxID=157739 RepID=A0A0S3SGL0_PHAAN|nr:hypothetical protein VIGAN_07063600 [Vigna angularis var. angularis]